MIEAIFEPRGLSLYLNFPVSIQDFHIHLPNWHLLKKREYYPAAPCRPLPSSMTFHGCPKQWISAFMGLTWIGWWVLPQETAQFRDWTDDVCVSCSVVSDILQSHGLQPTRPTLSVGSPDKNTGVSSHSLLWWISPAQGSNLSFLHRRQMLYRLSHMGSPELVMPHINSILISGSEAQIYLFPKPHQLIALGHLD